MILYFKFAAKSGFPSVFVLIFLFWIIGPFISGLLRLAFRTHTSPDYHRYIRTQDIRDSSKPNRPTHNAKEITKVIQVQPKVVRSLNQYPATCSACGGPINNTTVSWMGSHAECGYCGSTLKKL